MLQSAQMQFPDKKRYLYIDVEGHRNSVGGYDSDMFELQTDFVLGFLMKFFTRIHMPLIDCKNSSHQMNDIPDTFKIIDHRA